MICTSAPYELDRLIGQGGTAEVYLARDPKGREVALKRLRTNQPHVQVMTQYFWQEARILASLDHPNIPKLHDTGELEGAPYMVMEHLRGVSLLDLIIDLAKRKERLPAQTAIRIGAEVCRALEHVDHQLPGLVHRDISPHNIFMSEDDRVVLLDFGIAIEREDTLEGVHLKGKLPYMSPEQIQGKPLDVRSDLFSLCIVLWEALVGRRLFCRKTMGDTLNAVLRAEAPELSRFRPDLPPALCEVIAQGLAKRPEARPSDPARLRDALVRAAPRARPVRTLPRAESAPTRLIPALCLERTQLVDIRPRSPWISKIMGQLACVFLIGILFGFSLIQLLLPRLL